MMGIGTRTNIISVMIVIASHVVSTEYIPSVVLVLLHVLKSPIAVKVVIEKQFAFCRSEKSQDAAGGTQLNIRVPAQEMVKATKKTVHRELAPPSSVSGMMS